MQKFKSIILLFILGIILFPWQLICIEHPFGHEHHHHDGPSPCELYRQAMQQPGEHIFPPMDCDNISKVTSDYDQVQVEKTVPPLQLVAVVAVLFDLVGFEPTQQPFPLPPDPKCRSATLLSDSPLRAPPLV